MKIDTLEPGLLPVFRLLSGSELLVLLVILRLQSRTMDKPPDWDWYSIWVSLIFPAAVLLMLLSFAWFQEKLGDNYLIATLMTASIGPIIAQYLINHSRLSPGFLYDVTASAWQSVMILFVPLIITAWQYQYRQVVAYVFATSLASLGLELIALNIPSDEKLSFLGVLFIRTLFFLVLGYMITRLLKAQREQRSALAHANAQLVHYSTTLEELTISRERNRLARELHDTLAHTLSSQTVQLEAIKTLLKTDPENTQYMVEQTLQNARQGLSETRRAIQALRATPLEDLGLFLALRNLGEDAASRAGILFESKLPDSLTTLSPDVEQAIYRIAQEAFENAIRHSNAKLLVMEVKSSKNFFEMIIKDDGVGFVSEKVGRDHHFGLEGMYARAERINAQMEIQSSIDDGTAIRFLLGERDDSSVDM